MGDELGIMLWWACEKKRSNETIGGWISLVIVAGTGLAQAHTATASETHAPPVEITLAQGWHVTQDVREFGERAQWYNPEFAADWQPVARLAHLQLLFAAQPYFGRSLRSFHDYPWWYRLELATTDLV